VKLTKGFLLLECCIYIAICALLTLTIMQWLTRTIYETGRAIQVADKTMLQSLAHDVMMRDMQSAPGKRTEWIAIAPDYVVWKTNQNAAIGWYLHGANLVRKEGNYNEQLQQWGEHHSSVIAQGITRMQIDAHIDEHMVIGIQTILCWNGSTPSIRYVQMRNGRAV